MKKIKKLLVFLVALPLCFSLVSCKKKNNNTSNQTNNQQQEQKKDDPVKQETYSVIFDYNLPEGYSGLIENYSLTNKTIGTQTTLATVPDKKLSSCFLGWCYDGSEEIITDETISSSTAKVITLKGKWNIESINNYYYSDGLTFEVVGDKATIKSYTGSNKKVIISKYYKTSENEYLIDKIDDSVFENSLVEAITLNTGNISIGNATFKSSKLKTFDFEKVVSIGESSFENSIISVVNFSNNLIEIGKNAFKDSILLNSIDFGNSSVAISSGMFSGCIKLVNVSGTDNISLIKDSAFYGCVSLVDCSFVKDSVISIGQSAFAGCNKIVSFVIPKQVTNLQDNIFDDCLSLVNLTFSRLYNLSLNENDKLSNHIGNVYANIENIYITENLVSTLTSNYLKGFAGLKSIELCDSIVVIEDYAFYDCVNLKNIDFSQNIDLNSFSVEAFRNTRFLNELAEPLIVSNVIIYVPNTISSEYVVPANVTKIANLAFANNSSLQKITIPSSVSYIGYSAFARCSNLKEVTFVENSSLTIIADSLFYNCGKLDTIDLTKLTNLSSIGSNAFGFVNVSNFVIPSTVNSIGICAFIGAKISSFEIDGTVDKYNVVDDVLYYTNGSVNKLIAYPRSKELSLFVCPTTVTEIGAFAFSYQDNLKYVYFRNSSMNWESSKEANGDTVYTSFKYSSGIIVFAEQQIFGVAGNNVSVYRFIGSGYTYDSESLESKIVLDENFETDFTKCFIKVYDEVANKNTIVYFNIVNTGEDLIVNNSSIKVISNILDF